MKDKSKQRLYDETKYYRATYWSPDSPGLRIMGIPFAGKDILDANDYAKQQAPAGTEILSIEEYDRPTDAMTY